ncbi:DNA damage-inducible transcript 4-like protein isoform X2 [Narcine bancroftii]|uniref:DNA damage-inducible transcript 4-like protein isoform X2 n=1 Tax=Narcine bancroftii TaxID=1343680 RepID=UPI0038312721
MARLSGPDWADKLSWVLLGIRTAPKEDLQASAAEMVYGTPLSLTELNEWDHEPVDNRENEEEQSCQFLVKLLENCLSRAKKTKLHCSVILVPEGLMSNIARNMLHLASSEPCGLRGCVINVLVEIESKCRKLDHIVYDSTVVPTFELTLILKEGDSIWSDLRDFFFIGTCFSPGFRKALKFYPGFCLIKQKLYCSSSSGSLIEC